MNVTELARKLKLSVEVTRHIIPRVGFDIGMKAIKVEDKIANQIIERVSKSPQLIKEIEVELGLRSDAPKITTDAVVQEKGTIELPESIVVRDLGQLLNMPVTDLVKELMKNGIFANLNEDIDFETATIIAEDLGFKVAKSHAKINTNVKAEDINEIIKEDTSKTPRPPVIVVMGHVDHGKTMLLDSIRKTNVVDQEAGGITQHIGAYQITHNGRTMTFIDTPGHEAFTAMRSRGANVADIAILVVAWDDGMKPQTEEALSIIKKVELPFIVAVTKMDKPGASEEKVLQQLAEKNLLPEKWGGDTIVVPVSAKTKKGLEELLSVLAIKTDLDQDSITADPSRPGVGTIIESHIDQGEGPVATVIVQSGTLHTGDLITAGQVAGKVKSLKNDLGEVVKKAPPGMPVKILGLKELPNIGDVLQVTADKKKLKELLKMQKLRAMQAQERRSAVTKQLKEGKANDSNLAIIIKSDNLGTLEAIEESFAKLPQEDVKVEIVRKGLGAINESDIAQAAGTGAIVYGFHVTMPPSTEEIAGKEKADVRIFDVIYKLIEDVVLEIELRLPPLVTRNLEANMSVSALFRKKGKTQIVGGRIEQGKAKKSHKAIILRKKVEIGSGMVDELRIGSRVVETVESGVECGIKISHAPDIEVGDRLDLVTETETKRKLKY